jgi:dTMP kinase
LKKGLFISFEGSEGCGKTTQIQRLQARLLGAGGGVLLTREPGGTAIGDEIRQLLQFSPAGFSMKPETELLLFTASRAQLVREVIAPALESGVTVIADRFLDSTSVYQGVARKIDLGTVALVNGFAAGGCVPDITFVMDIDVALSQQRVMSRPSVPGKVDRMERQPLEFYERVRAGYLALAASDPGRMRLVDASRPVAEVEEEIWSHLASHGLFIGSGV